MGTAYVQSRICGAPSLGAAKAPSDIEVLMKRVSILPSPGDYKVRSNLGTKGGALDVDSDNTLIDMVLKHASQVPGPQDYAAENFPKPENDMFASLRRSVQKHLTPNARLLVHRTLVDCECRSPKI